MIAWRKWSYRFLHSILPSARAVRMAAYSGFAFGLLALASARSVYADVREMGLGVGHQLAKLEDLTGGAYLVRLNGAEMRRASAHTTQSTHEVLSRYEGYCRQSPGALGRAMQDIPSALKDRLAMPADPALRASVIRDEAKGRGMVVCFVDDADGPTEPLADRLRALAETGDLSKLGRFRYVFAEPSSGPSGGTHVVTFWSDGPLNLKTMFPASGDAPGTDSAIAPRPAGSRRTLSASVEGYPASVRIYESLAERGAIERMYDEALRAKGFAKVDGRDGAAYLRDDNAEIILSFVRSEQRTTVTIVETSAALAQGVRVEVAR
ncbi:MAG TPA: hypothetical protein VLT33_10860 [Labilithrix sp.]|nr:hypothetical protein [Labilithrix sp.]